MEIDYEYWEHQKAGIEKAACAWIIFLALVGCSLQRQVSCSQ